MTVYNPTKKRSAIADIIESSSSRKKRCKIMNRQCSVTIENVDKYTNVARVTDDKGVTRDFVTDERSGTVYLSKGTEFYPVASFGKKAASSKPRAKKPRAKKPRAKTAAEWTKQDYELRMMYLEIVKVLAYCVPGYLGIIGIETFGKNVVATIDSLNNLLVDNKWTIRLFGVGDMVKGFGRELGAGAAGAAGAVIGAVQHWLQPAQPAQQLLRD